MLATLSMQAWCLLSLKKTCYNPKKKNQNKDERKDLELPKNALLSQIF